MSDRKEPPDPEVGEIDEMVSIERRRMATEGVRPAGARSAVAWIVAVLVVVIAAVAIWASVGS